MKKLMILAISAIFALNASAQEAPQDCKGKGFNKEQRVEFEIQRLSQELFLTDQQAEKFAVTYREYAAKLDEFFQKKECPKDKKQLTEQQLDELAKKRFAKQKEMIDLKLSFYDRFRQDLNARQVARVLHLDAPCGPKPCFGKEGPKGKEHGPKHRHAPMPKER